MKGSVSEEALAEYSRLAAEKLGTDFAEGEVYDFARCMRADGSFYGTSGTCKKGTAAGDKEAEAPKTAGGRKRRATAETKAAGAAERKAAGAEKRADHSRRARLFKDELKKVAGKMKGADDETRNRLLQEASDRANKRHAAGEDAADKRAKSGGDATDKKVSAQVREANKQSLAGATDAARRQEETAKRRGNDAGKTKQLREAQEQLFDTAKEKRARAKEAERVHKELEKRVKANPEDKELRTRLRDAGRAWDKAGTAADRAQTQWMKAHEKWSKSVDRDKRAQMSPEQRKEARRIDKIIKERG
jgi:hypothetical protein